MREGRVQIAAAWLADGLLFAGCYVFAAAVLGMEQKAANVYIAGSLWLFLPIIVSFFAIRKIRSLVLYLLAGAAAAVLMKMLSGNLLTGILTAAIFLMRSYVRIKKGRLKKLLQEMPGEAGAALDREIWEIPTFLDRPGAGHWIFFAVLYAGLIFVKQDHLLAAIFYLAMADVFLVLIYRYLEGLNAFLEEHVRIANLPLKSMKRVCRMLLVLAVPLLFLFMLPAVLYHQEPLADLEFKSIPAPLMRETENIRQMNGFEEGLAEMLADERTEPPAWLNALSDVLMFLVSGGTILFLVGLLYKICRRAMQSFAHGEEDEIIFSDYSTEEERITEKVRSRAILSGWGNPNVMIRRHYKKTIKKNIKEKPKGWETPKELEQKANERVQAVSKELHDIYEKARYSREGCTKEETDILKK